MFMSRGDEVASASPARFGTSACLQEELDAHARGSGQHARLQQALDTLQQQVVQLQGQLADSNAVLDCSVMGKDASVVKTAAAEAARENAAAKARIDAVYAEREGEVWDACL